MRPKTDKLLGEIHDLSKQKSFFEWLKACIKKKVVSDPTFLQNAYSIVEADDKSKKNILKDFHSRMALFADPLIQHATSGNDFDLSKLRQHKMTIYINIPISDMDRLSPVLTLFWRQCAHLMTQREPNLRIEPYGVLALIDEFGNLAKIPALQKGMTFLRSYRIRCIPIVQHLGQIISIYGREDAKSFINTKIKIAFTLIDSDDALAFSKAMGQKTVRVYSISQNRGHGDHPESISQSMNYKVRALMTMDELMQMAPKKEIILVEGGMPIKANKCYWFRQLGYRCRLL